MAATDEDIARVSQTMEKLVLALSARFEMRLEHVKAEIVAYLDRRLDTLRAELDKAIRKCDLDDDDDEIQERRN